MGSMRKLGVVLLVALCAAVLAGCAAATPTPAPGPKTPPAIAPSAGIANPVARLGLAGAAGIEILGFTATGPGGQPGYVQRAVISDATAVAQVLSVLNADLKPLPKALCIPQYELRFRLPGGVVKRLMYSCDGASFLRGDDASWAEADLQPPASFDKLMSDLLAAQPPMPPSAKPPAVAESVPEVAELARDAALVIMNREQPGQSPAVDLPWQAKRMTPQDILGYETWQFSAKSWVVTVGYAVTRPDQVVYRVTVTNQNGGKTWERELTASQVPMGVPIPSGR